MAEIVQVDQRLYGVAELAEVSRGCCKVGRAVCVCVSEQDCNKIECDRPKDEEEILGARPSPNQNVAVGLFCLSKILLLIISY
jgi:hypothetical protein